MLAVRFNLPQNIPQRITAAISGRWAVAFLFAIWLAAAEKPPVLAAGEHERSVEFYERKVRPLLARHCYECHGRGAKRLEGSLALDTPAGIRAGGDNGPILDTHKPEDSLLLHAVRYDGDIQMPPTGKLSAAEIELLSKWINGGATLPDDRSVATARHTINIDAGRKFWSFQPPAASRPPEIASGIQPGNPIDAFLRQALERRGLKPSKPADARTLIRRATFDLVGLPPSPEEVEQFVSDQETDAYSKLIGRLLESPHYGERWGRYWLDLMRYADENKTSLEARGHAWLYRDWLVRALNEDLPYDQFVLKQLAADQISGTPPQDLAALGFLGLSPEYFKELKLAPEMIKAIVADEWEERIDTLGRTFLGLSLACARCHDHKFDPVTTADYYALAGVFASTRLTERFVVPPGDAKVVRDAQKKVRRLQEEIKKLKAAKPKKAEDQTQVASLEKQLRDIERSTPHYQSAMAHAVDDAALYVLPDGPAQTRLVYKAGEALDLAIQIRGNPGRLGQVTPRHFLTVLSPGQPKPFTHGSGRLELAQAIVGQAAPLTARVIVNRVWAHHFGCGLVESVSDFGTQGERPSHPELIDDLTHRFIEHGWSLKWLHRQIMTSRAYQQSSRFDAEKYALDPANRLLWRMNRRRLDVEAWRDAILAASGDLDCTMGGPPITLTKPDNRRRTLYARIDRSDPDDMLRLFDFPDPAAHAPSRVPTTTPLQQLFVLNGPFMIQQAAVLAEKLQASSSARPEAIVERAYRRLFARTPTAVELRLGVEFLTESGTVEVPTPAALQAYAQGLLGSNEFMFVD